MKTGGTIQRLDEARDNLASAISAVSHGRKATATQKIIDTLYLLKEVMMESTRIATPVPGSHWANVRTIMQTECKEHKQVPDPSSKRGCYGALWQCAYCHRLICVGYGMSDGMVDACDTCWSEAHGEGKSTCKRGAREHCLICNKCKQCSESLSKDGVCENCCQEGR